MKKMLIAAAAIAVTGIDASAVTLNGAGASFPAPVYRVWTYNYKRTAGARVNYQSVGSGAGINQIRAKTVDFGASDKPLKKAELDKYGLVQFPMLMGGVVVVVNIPGVKTDQLKLDGKTLADIFLGKIRKWNDPAITKLNPNLNIPAMPITVVHRSDSSGTTWIFTNYLTKVSDDWSKTVGNGKAVKWPVGIGGQKNPGVCNNVFKVRGSIGYVEYTYAFESKLATASLKNKAGNFVKPNLNAFQAAGASADWKNAPGYYMVLTDQTGKDSWPITGVTYILIYKVQKEMAKAKTMLKYFNWCYTQGASTAAKMHYVPIPKNVVGMVSEMWNKEVKYNGQMIK
ncbi:MAG: phosphate ABC transporter substrate-binding protein PstS [Lentisphaerae bacterium]|nr:phosphate ABC transporter substrate-binding protein PstS [Lentisphaerota bacterium]MCP4101211.1 phosphate ABC transporter substrate-binding protein PstS [Lentisphaerota bacterium]